MGWPHCGIEVGGNIAIVINTKAVKLAIGEDGWLNPSAVLGFTVEVARADNDDSWGRQPVAALDPAAHGFTRAASMASASS